MGIDRKETAPEHARLFEACKAEIEKSVGAGVSAEHIAAVMGQLCGNMIRVCVAEGFSADEMIDAVILNITAGMAE